MNLTANDYAKHLNECREVIALADMADALLNDVKFRQVILKDYLENQPLKLTYSLTGLDKSSQEYQKVISQLESISHFKDYFYGLIHNGQIAKDELHDALLIPEEEII